MHNRIREIRCSPRVSLSQEAFGERIGVTGAAISRIEAGKRNLTDRMIKTICLEFDVSEKWLRTGDGEMFDDVPVDEDFLRAVAQIQVSDDKVIKSILLAYWELGDAEKNAIKKLVDNFWEKYKKNAGQ